MKRIIMKTSLSVIFLLFISISSIFCQNKLPPEYILADYHIAAGRIDSSFFYLEKVQTAAEDNGDSLQIMIVLTKMANLFAINDKHKVALVYYQRSLEIAESIKQYPYLYQILASKGDLLQRLGRGNEALRIYHIGIQIFEDSLYQQASSEKEKQELLNGAFRCYSGAVSTAFETKDKELTIRYIQKYKARLFFEQLRDDSIYWNSYVKDVQARLKAKEAIIDYFVGIDDVFATLIDSKRYDVLKLGSKKDLIPVINLFKDQMQKISSKYNLSEEPILQSLKALQSLDSISTNFFQAFESEGLMKRINSLIIIPDDVIYHVPFECLLKRFSSASSKYDFLLKKHAHISYSPVLGILSDRIKSNHKAKQYSKDLLILEMSNFKSSLQLKKLESLKITECKKLFSKVDHMQDGMVKVCDLNKLHISDYRYILISTHGIKDKKSESGPYLILGDSLVSRDKIKELNLSSEVVFLSACLTGQGEFRRGEGMVNFANAFLLAGAKSVVVNLWPIAEEVSDILMLDFFKNLNNGLTPSTALAKAKKNLWKVDHGKYQHPFFWAGFVLFQI